ncbi:hypothetical protein [Nocardioides sp.]|uniref:hypothetical protein n=1 Tax=Nocardioides sp. TaxID=35761 RepID=UPI003514A341
MRTRLRLVGASLALAATAVTIPLLSSGEATAASSFSGGNLLVYRVGAGTAPLTNAATAVFLDEITPAGAVAQSIPVPTTAADGNLPLTASGLSRSEGVLSASPDGRFVSFTGYAAAPGATGPAGISLTGSDPASVARVVGVVDKNGTIETSTALPGASAPAIVRSAVTTDGESLLAAGGDGGLLATTRSSTAATVSAGEAATNLATVSRQAGKVLVSGLLQHRLAIVESGAFTDAPGLPSNLLTYGFAALDLTSAGWAGSTIDTFYIANASNRAGTVEKWRFDGTTFVKSGDLDVAGVSGLVADVEGSAVNLAVATPTQVLAISDTNGAGTGFSPAAPTVLETAPTNTEYRGIALAPTGDLGPSAFFRTPAAGSVVSIGAATAPVSVYVASPRAVSGVQISLGGSPAAATKGAGNIWTANVPTQGLAAGAGTITVTATDTGGSTTITRPVTYSGTSAPAGALLAGTYSPRAKGITASKGWTAYAFAKSPDGKGLTSKTKNAKLAFTAYGKTVRLTLGTGPKNGRVTLIVDGKKTTVDLFKAKAGTVVRTFTFTGEVRAHTVQIVVAGTKAAKSKGTSVPVGLVQVTS